MIASIITTEYVRSILDYDPETGVFTWKRRPREHFKTDRAHSSWNSRYSNKVAGYVDPSGYITFAINNRLYRAHRVAWFYMTGKWPKNHIDHVDMNKSSNIFVNLREATQSENGRNRRSQQNNVSGIKGIYYDKNRSKWCAEITVNGNRKYIGRFDCVDDATAAYATAAQTLHGEFARTQ